MSNIRPIVSNSCFCKICTKHIPKGENAYVFTSRFAGKLQQVHLHLECLRKMQEEVMLWHYSEVLKNQPIVYI